MSVGVMKDSVFVYYESIKVRKTKRYRDEVNKREVCESDG